MENVQAHKSRHAARLRQNRLNGCNGSHSRAQKSSRFVIDRLCITCMDGATRMHTNAFFWPGGRSAAESTMMIEEM
eukprot:1136864-Pelagomonas_calceolata.AAC.9